MRFDLAKLDTAISYKLLASTVVPRPIAWITTQDSEGRVNAAPYSFFNVMGSNPPTIAVGLLADPERGFKDTARNILSTGEFVVNLVPERLVESMNVTAVDAPAGIDELVLAGLDTFQSDHVEPPRIAASPVSFECVNQASIVTGPYQSVVIGRVLAIHVADRFVVNANQGHIDTAGLDLVGRGIGSDYYRTRETFELGRPFWKDWVIAHSDAGE